MKPGEIWGGFKRDTRRGQRSQGRPDERLGVELIGDPNIQTLR
jgi:hypothetical protein